MRYSPLLAAAAFAFVAAAQMPARADDAAPSPADAASPSKVVATVGGTPIHEYELQMAEDSLDPKLAKMPQAQRRVAALSTLIDVKTLAKKAKDENLEQSDQFKHEMEFLRERELHNLYFQNKVAGSITDADVKARYDKEIAAQKPEEEVKARHILVKTKAEAEAIIKKLDDGADFAKLAKENSTGPSASKGGELGYFTKGQMVPAFDKAVFALKKGDYTEEPVKTQFGWHVIQAEDTRQAPPPPLDQVSDQVKQVLMRERYAKVLDDARKDNAVDIKEPALKKAYDAANAASGTAGDQTSGDATDEDSGNAAADGSDGSSD